MTELKAHCDNKQQCYFIYMRGLRSSKTLSYNRGLDQFWIYNEIDGTDQTLSPKEMIRETNIPLAIDNGNFYIDKWETPISEEFEDKIENGKL
mgnify:CR=1 FL=1